MRSLFIPIQVFDISSLQIFSPQELDYLTSGHRELWEVMLSLTFFLPDISCLKKDLLNKSCYAAGDTG
jgi:hypothetical protein